MPDDAALAPGDKDLEPGQHVGEYVIEGKLGEGGFGTVFRASHPVIGKLVAIKVLSRQYSVQREMVSRFIAEARAVNQIRHRNIIDIFSFGKLEDGRHYYVMELLDGLTLAEHLERVHRMSLRDTLPILRAVARALDAAHAKGIAHRDLKPENIYLATDSDGGVFPKLLDFGIAKLLVNEESASHKTRTGAPIGTPLYMSPEQCRGQNVDHRTDVYAFGIVAFRMLTGKVPFDGDNYMTILMLQMTEPPPPASSFVSDLPLEVDRAIQWMLAKEPAARPSTLQQAVEALEHAAALAGQLSPTWGATPPVGALVAPRAPTAPPGLSLAATMHASAGAATQASISANRNTTPEVVPPHPPHRAKWPLVALAGLVISGGLAFALTRGGGDEAPRIEGSGSAAASGASAPGARAGGATAEPGATVTSAEPASSMPATPATSAEPASSTPATPATSAGTDRTDRSAANGSAALDTITLTFKGLPDNAVVYGPKRRPLGLASDGLTLPRSEQPMPLSFEADGVLLARATVVPLESRELSLTVRPTRTHDRRRRKPEPAGNQAPRPADPDSTERPTF